MTWHWWPPPTKAEAKEGKKGGFYRSPNRKQARKLKRRQDSFDSRDHTHDDHQQHRPGSMNGRK